MVVFGTRPEAIKTATVIKALAQYPREITPVIVSTGQHGEMLAQVLSIFNIRPHYDLDIMTRNQSLANITAKVLTQLGPVLEKEAPDIILVQGDTTTAFAAALCGFFHKCRVGHIEAGLRTHDRYSPFPEEMNRTLISPLAHVHFAPTPGAKGNLIREGIRPESILVTGNTVIDALLSIVSPKRKNRTCPGTKTAVLGNSKQKTILLTAHRRENWGTPLENICKAVLEILERYPDVRIVFPVHLNPLVQTTVKRILSDHERIQLMPPLDYLSIASYMAQSHLILTDSGGIQEEAPSLGVPVLVLRRETERQEGILAGNSRLVGTRTRDIVREVCELMDNGAVYARMSGTRNPYGDGKASQRILTYIRKTL